MPFEAPQPVQDTAPQSAPDRTAPLKLWRRAASLLETLLGLFGMPAHIALQLVHTSKERALMLPWLRAAEAMMRRLLLLEAAALPKPDAPLPRPRTRPRQRAPRDLPFADQPQTWRVSFRCFSSTVLHGGSGARRRRVTMRARKPKGFFNAGPLAERLEALLRVYENPRPYAQRLARRIFATPQRARSLIAAAAGVAHKIGEEIFAELGVLCDAATAPNSS